MTVRVGTLAGWVERTGDDPERYHYVILDFWAEPVGSKDLRAGDDARRAEWVPIEDLEGLDLVDGLFDFLAELGNLRDLRSKSAANRADVSVRTQRSPARGEAAARRVAREPER